jgi:citrate synthase
MMMPGPKNLLRYEDKWETVMGMVFPGEKVIFRGKDMFKDLRNISWMELFLLGITGRRFNKKQVRLFEALWILSTSYPDPRIWNNRVASLAGTVRSTGALGISAAIAVSEAQIYGFKPIIGAYDLLTSLSIGVTEGNNLEPMILSELEKSRRLPGYARPLIREDERIGPLLEIAREIGADEGAHVQIAFQVEHILQKKRYRMKMNVAALAAALAADQGLSRSEYYYYVIPCFIAGITPCYIEANMKTPGQFLPIRCNRLNYIGKIHRKWCG